MRLWSRSLCGGGRGRKDVSGGMVEIGTASASEAINGDEIAMSIDTATDIAGARGRGRGRRASTAMTAAIEIELETETTDGATEIAMKSGENEFTIQVVETGTGTGTSGIDRVGPFLLDQIATTAAGIIGTGTRTGTGSLDGTGTAATEIAPGTQTHSVETDAPRLQMALAPRTIRKTLRNSASAASRRCSRMLRTWRTRGSSASSR